MISDGLRRYGFDEAALKVFMGLLGAVMSFEEFRLPELFSGFSKEEYGIPVHYPVACHPQAWAAGSIPFLLCRFLGLEPNALDGKLEICRPLLPESVHSLDVTGIRVGPATIDLHYSSVPNRRTRAEVIKVNGKLDVTVS